MNRWAPGAFMMAKINSQIRIESVPLISILVILAIYVLVTLITAIAAVVAGSPFTLWFKDTEIVLAAVVILLVALGIVWDGLWISAGLISETLGPWTLPGLDTSLTVESVRRIRFFTCGLSPTVMIVATAFVILGTSNITLLSLKLVGNVTEWRDPIFWAIEQPVFDGLTRLPVNAAAWDRLYHSAWGIELIAAFILVLLARGPRIVAHYCVSLILLFYVGRWLGLLNPVMGPAFYRPEAFGYLSGSATATAMREVAAIMAQSPEQAIHRGAVLLGGVSAMPSLHVAMVAVTAFWLAMAKRWTLYITGPWVLLVWTSTVVLGWHYVLDGAGGILLAVLCAVLTSRSLASLGLGFPGSSGATESIERSRFRGALPRHGNQ